MKKIFRVGLVVQSVLILIFSLVTSTCDEPIEETDNPKVQSPEWSISTSIYPHIGSIHTHFKPSIYIIEGSDTSEIGECFNVRFDYNLDGTFETDWLDSIPTTPAFGNDGVQAFAFEVRDTSELFSADTCELHIGALIQITPTNTSNYSQYNIDWSRDGSNRVAFDMYGGEPGANQSIWIVQYPGGEPLKVSSNPNPGEYFFDNFPEWSPLGDRIACVSSNGLDIIEIETGSRQTLVNPFSSYSIDWSPDGRYIIYPGFQGGSVKTLLHDFTNDTTTVLFENDYEVAWSPDGARIAVRNNPVQIVNFESGVVEQEYFGLEMGSKIDWSPDGLWLSLGFVEYSSVSVLNVETGDVVVVQPDGLDDCWWPSWNEDGSLLAFEAEEKGVAGIKTSIWAIQFFSDI